MPRSVTFFLVALLTFVASKFVIWMLPVLTPTTGEAYFRADFILPCAALWLTYWAIFHASSYLRPRTMWRELELIIPAFVLVCVSWWIRVFVLALRYGM